MKLPDFVDVALPAEGVFLNLVFVSSRKTYPMQAYKIMHGLWVTVRKSFPTAMRLPGARVCDPQHILR